MSPMKSELHRSTNENNRWCAVCVLSCIYMARSHGFRSGQRVGGGVNRCRWMNREGLGFNEQGSTDELDEPREGCGLNERVDSNTFEQNHDNDASR